MTEPRTGEFGDVSVDLSRMRVTRGGTVVDIEPKVFDVLRFLVERRDRLLRGEAVRE